MHVYLTQQREKPLTWRDISISASSAKEFRIHRVMSLSIQGDQVLGHGISSPDQDLLNFGEILGK